MLQAGKLESCTLLIPLLLGSLCCSETGRNRSEEAEMVETETRGEIERLDPRLDRLVPPNAAIEVLAEGFDWSEGPVWWPSREALFFSDVPQNVAYRWDGEEITEFLRPSGFTGVDTPGREPGSNGLAIDLSGCLVLCQHGDRRVARLLEDGSFETIVDRYEGNRFNSPNDLVYHSNGDLYFTDPPYGLEGLNDSPQKELTFNGVYRYSTEGELTLLTDELTFPNGIAFSPDESILYVAVSDPENPVVMSFPLNPDGTLGEGRLFFDASPWAEEMPGLPDGMAVDEQGNLFATGPGGVNVISPDGTLLGRLNIGVATANCAWGDQGSTLYVTADSYLCRVRLATRGFLLWDQMGRD